MALPNNVEQGFLFSDEEIRKVFPKKQSIDNFKGLTGFNSIIQCYRNFQQRLYSTLQDNREETNDSESIYESAFTNATNTIIKLRNTARSEDKKNELQILLSTLEKYKEENEKSLDLFSLETSIDILVERAVSIVLDMGKKNKETSKEVSFEQYLLNTVNTLYFTYNEEEIPEDKKIEMNFVRGIKTLLRLKSEVILNLGKGNMVDSLLNETPEVLAIRILIERAKKALNIYKKEAQRNPILRFKIPAYKAIMNNIINKALTVLGIKKDEFISIDEE